MGIDGDEGRIWPELSATLRALRQAAGASLRTVEAASGFGRGALSSMENAKSRPSRAVVEYYDRAFSGDGLVMSMFAEARGARAAARTVRARSPHHDVLRVESARVPTGLLVAPGTTLTVGWRLRNAGTTCWAGRGLGRLGAPTGAGLVRSEVVSPIPDAAPGETVDVSFEVGIPDAGGTLVAYWQLVDAEARPTTRGSSALRLLVVAAETATTNGSG